LENYSIETYIKDIRVIVSREVSQEAITESIKPLAKRLAADKSWIKPEYREVDTDQVLDYIFYTKSIITNLPYLLLLGSWTGLEHIIIKLGRLLLD